MHHSNPQQSLRHNSNPQQPLCHEVIAIMTFEIYPPFKVYPPDYQDHKVFDATMRNSLWEVCCPRLRATFILLWRTTFISSVSIFSNRGWSKLSRWMDNGHPCTISSQPWCLLLISNQSPAACWLNSLLWLRRCKILCKIRSQDSQLHKTLCSRSS